MRAYWPLISNALQTTNPALMTRFKKTILETGEHQGTSSVGTHTLNIQTRKSMIEAKVMMVIPETTYLIIWIVRLELSACAATMVRMMTSKRGMCRNVSNDTRRRLNAFLNKLCLSRLAWFFITIAIIITTKSMNRQSIKMAIVNIRSTFAFPLTIELS